MTEKPSSTDTDEQSDDGTGVTPSEQRRAVRERYGEIGASDASRTRSATETNSRSTECCSSTSLPSTSSSSSASCSAPALAERLGYDRSDLDAVADGAELGLGCGNPTAIAELSSGETVLDLGSGGGFDCFLAAQQVGEGGHVIGVDMTPEMVERARENARKNDASTVDFRLGEIEHLPVADESVDVIISNCVVNLSPAKQRVFDEAARVLRPGGRLAISDVVFTAEPPSDLRSDLDTLVGCVGGASRIQELREFLDKSGFESISIEPKDGSEEFIREWSTEYDLEAHLVSATIEARKPE